MDFLREIVSGKKKRFKDGDYNLDLTYITPRIVAMSFPASGIEKAYRNSLDEVAKFFRDRHGKNYLVFNLSGRKYDYSKFEKVHDFPWEDHHSPAINVLFQVCELIHDFLKAQVNNVVVVHCLAGKGRTGTIICCYLLYCRRVKTPEEALMYYSKKRFGTKELGVTQPSQKRYVFYFFHLLNNWGVCPTVKFIESIFLQGVPKFSSNNSCKPVIELFTVKDVNKIYSDKLDRKEQRVFSEADFAKNVKPVFKICLQKKIPLCGDILLRLKNNGKVRKKLIGRVAFNTAFIPKENSLTFQLKDIDPDSLIKDVRFPKDFSLIINFSDFCKCDNSMSFANHCSLCKPITDKEKFEWDIIYSIMMRYQEPDPCLSKILVFGDPDFDDIDEIMKDSMEILQEDSNYESPNSDDQDDFQIKYIGKALEEQIMKDSLTKPLAPRKSRSFNNLELNIVEEKDLI